MAGLSRSRETAHATEAAVAAPSPKPVRPSSRAVVLGRAKTISASPERVTSEPAATAPVTGSSRKTAARTAPISGYVIVTVMAGARPRMARALEEGDVAHADGDDDRHGQERQRPGGHRGQRPKPSGGQHPGQEQGAPDERAQDADGDRREGRRDGADEEADHRPGER